MITNEDLARQWADREGIRYSDASKSFDEIAQDYRAAASEFDVRLAAVRRAAREVWEAMEGGTVDESAGVDPSRRYGEAEHALQRTQARLQLIEDAIESRGGYIYPYSDPATVVAPVGADWRPPRAAGERQWEVVNPNRTQRGDEPPTQTRAVAVAP
ncbi:MAG: hypothetical protein CVT65_00740 [Actinobacteria bacterium HGW-Actinobacteria-5]|nr:MAG: hypothetical protein CVT65_00740 [Actinobacteria bacterium HGW-Actinobacteria-5]